MVHEIKVLEINMTTCEKLCQNEGNLCQNEGN